MVKDNKAFCILPWVHAQVRQNGEVYPCCRVKHSYSYGSTHNEPLFKIWNSEKIKKVRSEMLQGKKQSFCSDCHTTEELGSKSYRQSVNEDFQKELLRIEQTDSEGFLANSQIIYLDIRFSNVCNYKCRSCNPDSSNLWFEDYQQVHKNWVPEKRTHKLVIDSKTIFADIEALLPNIQKIYFAGGEPLLDESHYLLLEKLIVLGRTDIEITYNSNVSHLNFKNWNALQLWQKFKNVQVSASIDAIGASLEILRKGSNWNETKSNLTLIQKFVPTVFLQIYPTVSVLNCFKLVELIDYFLENGFIEVNRQFEINLLNDPPYINISILTKLEIDRLEKAYNDYIFSIRTKIKSEVVDYLDSELKRVIKFARHQDLTHLRPSFKKYSFTLDHIRNEKTIDSIPELFELLYE